MTEIIPILFTYNYKYGILIKQKLIYQRMKAISVNSYHFIKFNRLFQSSKPQL